MSSLKHPQIDNLGPYVLMELTTQLFDAHFQMCPTVEMLQSLVDSHSVTSKYKHAGNNRERMRVAHNSH